MLIKTYRRRSEICGPCGGTCCKQHPGFAAPDDFADIDDLVACLSSGRWAVDWWEPQSQGLYLVRPAVKGHEGQLFHGTWGGECTFLTPGGCELRRRRPLQCRTLRPLRGDCCDQELPGKEPHLWHGWAPFFDSL